MDIVRRQAHENKRMASRASGTGTEYKKGGTNMTAIIIVSIICGTLIALSLISKIGGGKDDKKKKQK